MRPGLLRDAIAAANADAATDQITFESSLSGRIELIEGDLPVDGPVTVLGPGREVIELNAGPGDRIFDIDVTTVGAAQDPVRISGLTLTDGDANFGAAIRAYGTALSVESTTLVANDAAVSGGAIFSADGSVRIEGSTLADNYAGGYLSGGGGILMADSSGDGEDLVIVDSALLRNEATGTGGAIFAPKIDGDVRIERTIVSGNTTGRSGGGISLGHSLSATDSTTTIADSTFTGNAANIASGGRGGALFLTSPGEVAIVNSTFDRNLAGGSGGAINVYNQYDSPISISASTITGNRSISRTGGGIYREGFDDPDYAGSDPVEFTNTIVAGNEARRGPDLGEPYGADDASFSATH